MNEPTTQLHLFGNAIQIALDETAKGLQAGGTTPNSDAALMALAGKLGERIAAFPERNARRLVLKRVIQILEIASRRT